MEPTTAPAYVARGISHHLSQPGREPGTTIGAAPHLTRPNLPQPANYYPADVQLALLPFGEQALRHFMFLERPEGMDLADADGLRAVGRAQPHLTERDIVPRGQDFATVGHLYRSIEAGLARLTELHGEDWLFVGPQRAQATPGIFGWPELIPVTDLASAQRAIDEILEQGEDPRGHWQDAHFGQFVQILDEYQQMVAVNPDFDPVRPAPFISPRACQPNQPVDRGLAGRPAGSVRPRQSGLRKQHQSDPETGLPRAGDRDRNAAIPRWEG